MSPNHPTFQVAIVVLGKSAHLRFGKSLHLPCLCPIGKTQPAFGEAQGAVGSFSPGFACGDVDGLAAWHCFFGGNEADTFASKQKAFIRVGSALYRVACPRRQVSVLHQSPGQQSGRKCVVSLLEAAKFAQPLVKCLALRPHHFSCTYSSTPISTSPISRQTPVKKPIFSSMLPSAAGFSSCASRERPLASSALRRRMSASRDRTNENNRV